MLTRPSKIVPQPDEGPLGPGSTDCLAPGDCPGVGIQAVVPRASGPLSISRDASFPAKRTLRERRFPYRIHSAAI